MIFQSFILDNLVSLCLKIINSVIVVGLYYGFMTTFSTGPSYLFLLRAHVMEEGTEKKISATTGFITGQLVMFISIYYAPLHIALDRPHTITVITLPYLLLYFLGNNQKNFLNYVYKNQNSIRHFSIQRIFFQNLFFQLLNPFFLPSSILMRLANIYIFQSNNKVLFLTSSFVGWLIGHVFFMKWIGLMLVWIQEKNNSIKSTVAIRSNKGVLAKFRKSMFQIFLIFFFITCLYYLGRIPPIYFFTPKMSEIKERGEIEKREGEIDIEINSQRAGSKQEQKITAEEKLSPYLFSKKNNNLDKIKEENDIFGFQKPLVTILFDYNRWNRPLRYIKNDRFENVVRNEISQFFFFTCQSDGKERISFTYPPNLSTFQKMMEMKISLFTRDIISYEELSNSWRSTNEEKKKKLTNEFLNRVEVLDKESLPVDIFENRIRLCNDEKKQKYLTKEYDPFLNGPCRGQIQKWFSPPIQKETYKKNSLFINKIHGILFSNTNNYPKFEQKKNIFDRKSLLTDINFFFNLITKFSRKSVSSLNFEGLYLFPKDNKGKMSSKKKKFLFDTIRPDLNDNKIVNLQKCIGINEIVKKLPRWSYNLIDELEQLEGKKKVEYHQIRSRKAKRVVLLTKNSQNDDNYDETTDTDNTEKKKELALIRYSQQPDFRRDIIKGSIRAQRRKTVTCKLFQRSVDSPLFLEKMEKTSFFCFDILDSSKIFFMFKNWIRKKKELKNSDYTDEKAKESQKKEEEKIKKNEKEEKRRIEIGEAWDSIIFAQVIRGCLLITQSILRKYILLPSLIITKNIVRILLFQFPEWSEDFRDWQREMYIKCTYNGVQLSETEFPKKWLTDGIQIKILFPFRLKPWHRSKLRFTEKKKDPLKNKKVKKKNFCFLTIFGMEVELPFSGYPRNRFSFFDPILKELKKKMKKLKNNFFLILKIVNERTKNFITTLKETSKRIIQSILKKVLFLNKKIKKLYNYLFLFRFKKIDELNQNKKNFPITKNNPIIYESTILIQAINKTNCSLTEKKIKAINAKTKKIIKKIERMTKENKGGFLISEINSNSKKTSSNTKGLELEKKILQILQRRNVQLTHKLYSFFKFLLNFMKKVYTDIFLCIVSVPRINVQFFLESTKKIINQSIYNKKTNEEIIDKTNQSIIHFISIINKSSNTKNTNSAANSYEVSALSQAYVFFKISQIQVLNVYKYKFKYVFDYDGRSFFIKDEIKDYFFGIQGIIHSKLRHKNSPVSLKNQWTNWLKVHYQYDLSQNRWSRLVQKNLKNRINKHRLDQNKDLTKCDSYKKTQLIVSKNKKQQVDFLVNLLIQKKIKKQSRYDLLLYKFINYAEKKELSIYGYRSPFQANKKRAISYDYNTQKKEFFDRMDDISIKNYIAEDAIRYIEQNRDRKYFDWVVMDVKIQNNSISNLQFSFFFKFLRFYDAYRNKPWIIPIKFLFLHFSVNQNFNKIKNIIEKKRRIDIFKPWKKKKILEVELETPNRAKKEYTSRVDLNKPSLSNQEKDIEEDYGESDSKKGGKDKNKKKYKNKIEAEVNLLLRKYLNFHLNWKGSLNKRVINNVKVYCLLIRLKNIKQIAISSIQRGELSLDIMMIQNEKDSTLTGFRKKKEFIEKGIFIIEPVRLSRKNNEQFFMYETARLLLIHKSKRQINQRNPEKSDLDKQIFYKNIPPKRDQRITQNKEKKHYALVVIENILSARRRRELRILICFNPRSINSMPRKTIFDNENKINNCCQVFAKNKDLDKEKKILMNLKLILWPNYRLEDLACINRYWFDTYNGSRFSIVRIHMYPRLKMR
uniref:Protein TIC 214 n=1 Tax=Lotus japonicus TaxID=34305 RepID=TI214_LOTJA|nr:hypothetical protein LocoCp080 [Lotus japonicus]Q9BBN6.1 RecName: Full=Protein TIC 214; AltName: Full=Translocon at the inner envelope membrane of chloroplasts 214; Short=AtTIC214 [Lotus japonicus]BAB33253.1 hypothetical protein [Lotus japonicus]